MGMNMYDMTADAPDSCVDAEGCVYALDMAEREGRLACISVKDMSVRWMRPVYCPFVRDVKEWYPSAIPPKEKAELMLDHMRMILDSCGAGHAAVAAANEIQNPDLARMLISEAGRRDIELVPVNLSIAGACGAGIPSGGRDLVIDQRYDVALAAEIVWKDARPAITGAHMTGYGWKKPFEAVKSMMDLSAMMSGKPQEVYGRISAGILENLDGIMKGTVNRISTGLGDFAVDRMMLESAVDPKSARLKKGNMGTDAKVERRYFESADRVILTGSAATQSALADMVIREVPDAKEKIRQLPEHGVLAGAARYMMMRRGMGA